MRPSVSDFTIGFGINLLTSRSEGGLLIVSIVREGEVGTTGVSLTIPQVPKAVSSPGGQAPNASTEAGQDVEGTPPSQKRRPAALTGRR